MFTIVEVEVDIDSWVRRPAVTSRRELYLIKDNKVIGVMEAMSARSYPNTGIYERVTVEPTDTATKEFFKDDPGWIDGHLYGLKYSGLDGSPYVLHDEDEGRHKGTKLVDKFDFDFGIAHASFSGVEGFGRIRKKSKPKVHVPQKRRRPRNSNKIKKIIS